MEDLFRRVGSARPERVALAGTALASLSVLAGFVVALASGRSRLSDVGAALSFLLIVAVGLYASRLGAPGRSA